MKEFVFFCKSYRNDLKLFIRLVDSFNLFNVDSIEMYISVPEEDIALFNKFSSKNITVISDESYAKTYFTEKNYWNLPIGYINQEICKLSFWETGISKNYLCIDSDLYFIKKFYLQDFMFDKKTPYSVLVMDKDLIIEKHYNEFGKWRQNLIKKIFEYVELDDKRLLTCHGMQVLNSSVLKNMKKFLLNKRNITYKELIEISPYEFTWYNAWLQKSKVIPILNVEPFFKTFHMKNDYVFSRLKLLDESDYSLSYIGIVLNSNWESEKMYSKYKSPGYIEKLLNIFFKIL